VTKVLPVVFGPQSIRALGRIGGCRVGGRGGRRGPPGRQLAFAGIFVYERKAADMTKLGVSVA
jgi:hypothetical protein